jgi:hypothetical protein
MNFWGDKGPDGSDYFWLFTVILQSIAAVLMIYACLKYLGG